MLNIKGHNSKPFVPPISMYALFLLSCTGHFNNVVVDEKGLRFTRKEMKRDINTLAKALRRLGVKEGDIVTVYSGRSMYANIVSFFAVNRLKATICFHDESVARDTLIQYLDEFESSVLLTYRKDPKWIEDLKRDTKTVQHVINMDIRHGERDFDKSILEKFRLDDGRLVPDVAKEYRGLLPLTILGADREALISFTSGSTSGPKPMVFTNRNLIASAIYSKEASGVAMWDYELRTWMSFVHLDCPYGLVVSVLAPICGGGEVIVTPDIDEVGLEFYLNSDPNVIFGIPSLLENMMESLDQDLVLRHLRMFASGGERLSKETSLAARDFFFDHGAWGVKIANGYGTGELLGLISTAVGNTQYNPDSVGKVPAGVEVAVIKPETGEELGFDETGILCATGDHALTRYFDRPDLDREKFIDIDGVRYVNTGDIASVSEEGVVTLVGRARFFIDGTIPAKVYYEVVNAAMMQADAVKKCYVVRGPGEGWNFQKMLGNWVPYAFVETNDGYEWNDQTRAEILEQAKQPYQLGQRRDTLKAHEVPRRIIFMDKLPQTTAGKTNFRELEQMAIDIAREDANDEG